MVLVSLAVVSASLDGKAMFALSKLVTPDVPLMECVPMGLACVLMVSNVMSVMEFSVYGCKIDKYTKS